MFCVILSLWVWVRLWLWWDSIPMIRLCYMSRLTLRKEDYPLWMWPSQVNPYKGCTFHEVWDLKHETDSVWWRLTVAGFGYSRSQFSRAWEQSPWAESDLQPTASQKTWLQVYSIKEMNSVNNPNELGSSSLEAPKEDLTGLMSQVWDSD